MEIVKENVQMLRVKSRATNQITFDEDYNVPDAKPDIGRMIQNKGTVQVDEVNLNDNQAYVKAKLMVELLYVEEQEEGRICSLTAALPIEETLNLEGIESGDKMCLKWEIEDLSLHVINSRKLNIKSILSFFAVVDELVELALPTGLQPEEISMKKKIVKVLGLCIHKKDTVRMKEEVALASNKPNIAQVLWNTVEVRGMDIRPEEDHILLKGELFMFLLYRGDEEGNSLQWLEHSIPFYQEVECQGCRLEMIPNVEVTMLHQRLDVQPDSDGEERVVQVDAVLELDIQIYNEEEHSLLMDIYTPLRECVAKGGWEPLDSLLVKNFSKCRIGERIQVREVQGKILQICHSQGCVKVDTTQTVENGVLVEGVVSVKVLYIVSDDSMPFYSMEAMVPFSHVIEAVGIDENSIYHLHTDLEQLSTTMVDSNEIEVKIVLNLNALILNRQQEYIIREIEEHPLNMEKIQSMPGITVYMVQPGDTLWDIAKSFYTTVEDICQLNGLEEQEVPAYRPLLLVKRVEEE